MMKQELIGDLIGRISSPSDLRVDHHRNRYVESVTVNADSFFRMKIDRLDPIALLDCRNIKMRFNVTCTSTDAGICLANNSAYPFQSVRVLCGTKVVVDINNAALLNSILYNSTQDNSISAYEQSITGDTDLFTRQAAADGVKEYMITMFPPNTFLNGDHLLDVNNMADLTLEFRTLRNSQYLFSPLNVNTSSYQLSNIAIEYPYIFSASLAAHFRSYPMSFTCYDYTYSYDTAALTSTQLQVPSSKSSLNGLLLVMRDVNVENTFNTLTKMTQFNSNNLADMNLLINQVRFFDNNIDSYNLLFQELCHFVPQARIATFFTSAYNATRFLLGVRLAAAPPAFREVITSGVKTASLNNNIIIQLNFAAAPTTLQRCDIFLQSDYIVSLTPNSREIEIKY